MARIRYGLVERSATTENPRAYLRITFSEAVSASMYAGRLNNRSAYFISGAACLPNWMP